MKTMQKLLIIIVAALAAVYIGISLFFVGHFPFHTTLNGMNVSGKSPAAVESAIAAHADGYSLQVTGRNGASDTITAQQIGLAAEFDGTIKKLQRSLSPFAWPVHLFRSTSLTSDTVVSYDESKLGETVKAMSCFAADKQVAPTNATYGWNGDAYEVVVENQGSQALEDKVLEAVKIAVNGLQPSLDLDAAGCYAVPTVTSEDETLKKTVDSLNQLVSQELTLDMGAGTVLTLDHDTIREWVSTDDSGNASIDNTKVADYVTGLQKEYETIYTNRTFRMHDGNTITTAGGSYGWWMDTASTTQAILDALSGNHQATAVWFEQPAARGDNTQCGSGSFGGDIGSSYVEVDLDNQKVYCWNNGSLVVETECVSGNAAKGNGTPDGVYPITYKERDATLVGENYSSPVSYWMPFNGNVGLHDASWRSSFGGTLYLTSGSHGCVNLPVSAAKQIFGYVEKGMAVVVYGGASQDAALETAAKEKQQQESENASKYKAAADQVASSLGIDTAGAVVNSDGSVTYAIGATVWPDGHVTGADGSTIVPAGGAAAAGSAASSSSAASPDASGAQSGGQQTTGGTDADQAAAAQAAAAAAAAAAAQAAGQAPAGQ
ncbi:MAG: peptidoglycan binding domain-containing protein [Lachnospiraceae bacterium]|nr:peptidoglycan binding domain-containing protein [Lachnospiraceae bacterium]